MWSSGVLLYVMLLAQFPFDSGVEADNYEQLTYNVWSKQVGARTRLFKRWTFPTCPPWT